MSAGTLFCSHAFYCERIDGDSQQDTVDVHRHSQKPQVVCLSIHAGESGFNYYSQLMPAQAQALGRALMAAAEDALDGVPVTKTMGPQELQARRLGVDGGNS